jgi:hypothetical protein
MTLTFELEPTLEHSLGGDVSDLGAAAKEALLVMLYRQRKISHYALSQSLGLDRLETEELLHRHKVTEDLPSADVLLSDPATLQNLRARG